MKSLVVTFIFLVGAVSFASTDSNPHKRISDTIETSYQALNEGEVSFAESAIKLALNYLAETNDSSEKTDNIARAQELLDTAGANFKSIDALQSKLDSL